MKSPFICGLITGVFVCLLYVTILSVNQGSNQSEEPQKDFEVVANYKGCDIIRWNNPTHREYQYFMKCKK